MQSQQQQQNIKQNVIKKTNANQYGSRQYWQQRYLQRDKQRFQWLVDYQLIKDLLQQFLEHNFSKKILNLGCGNGIIQDKLYQNGYKYSFNNDISKVVIDQMQEIKKQKGYSQMKYQVMDVTSMDYPDKFFDIILDKSTLDALLCSENPYLNTAKMIQHVFRTMKDDGVYIVISYGRPEDRLIHLRREHVNFEIQKRILQKETQKGKLTYWAYICHKNIDKQQKLKNKQWKQQFYKNLKQQEDIDYS